METLLDTLDYTFNQRALLSALLIGFLNGFFGAYVVLRRAALAAGALANTLFPGVALGVLLAGFTPLSALLGALFVALLVGMGSQWLAANTRADLNTLLAVFWTAAFAGGLIILQSIATPVDLNAFLFGNILGVSDSDLVFIFTAGFLVLSVVILLQRPLLLMMFSPPVARTQGVAVSRLDLLMAAMLVLVMITSLQAVGTLLALGLLVAPAAILMLFTESPRILFWGGGLLGAGVASISVFLANALNVLTGALIVILLAILYLMALFLSPRYGLLSKKNLHHAPSHE